MLAEGLAIFAEELRLRRLQRPRKLCALCFAGIDFDRLSAKSTFRSFRIFRKREYSDGSTHEKQVPLFIRAVGEIGDVLPCERCFGRLTHVKT